MLSEQLTKKIGEAGVIAVITIDEPAQAVPLAKALLAGGVAGMELTLRTPKALGAIEAIAGSVPEMTVGAGTVLTKDQVTAVRDAGAAFAVAPGFNPDILAFADEIGFPFAPGVMTPSEIENAFAAGCSVLKFYHAGVAGGLKALKALTAPYAHLGIRFIPLGGVSQDNLAEWVAEKSILAVGGSWIAPREEIAEGNWDAITSRAREAMAVFKKERGA